MAKIVEMIDDFKLDQEMGRFYFDTGIRVSELCDIKVEDVASKHILIHGKGSMQRLLYISKVMRKYMRSMKK